MAKGPEKMPSWSGEGRDRDYRWEHKRVARETVEAAGLILSVNDVGCQFAKRQVPRDPGGCVTWCRSCSLWWICGPTEEASSRKALVVGSSQGELTCRNPCLGPGGRQGTEAGGGQTLQGLVTDRRIGDLDETIPGSIAGPPAKRSMQPMLAPFESPVVPPQQGPRLLLDQLDQLAR